MTTTIPRSSISIPPRLRKDYKDVERLAQSIKEHGLIHPPVVNQNNELVAGGRRLAAIDRLGWQEVPITRKETLDMAALHELEVEENVRRESMTWQEHCLGIAEIHTLRKQRAALGGEKWGMRETAEMMGLKGYGNVSEAIYMAGLLKSELDSNGKVLPSARFWQCVSFSDAWQLSRRDELERIQAELARRQAATVIEVEEEEEGVDLALMEDLVSTPSENPLVEDIRRRLGESGFEYVNIDEAKVYYLNVIAKNPNPLPFDKWWEGGQKILSRRYRLSLDFLHNVDCIDFMLREENKEKYDHIITDPPYGIDMEMLSQDQGGLSNIDSVENEHDIEDNVFLFTKFFKAAFHCLKPNAFLVTWTDISQWDLQYNLAIRANFKVQRWPITWVKQHACINQAAQFNFTKTTEIAMVCRKGLATLSSPCSCSHILAAHDDFKDTAKHPFVKPYAVWEFITKPIAYPGQLILEPFAGEGSGVQSLLRMGMKVEACEVNKEHYNTLLENVKNHYLRQNPNYNFI